MEDIIRRRIAQVEPIHASPNIFVLENTFLDLRQNFLVIRSYYFLRVVKFPRNLVETLSQVELGMVTPNDRLIKAEDIDHRDAMRIRE